MATSTPRSAARITLLPGFQEMLAYVASSHGVAIVGTQTEQLYPRPGLACVPIAGRPTFDYAPVWRTDDLNALASNFLHDAATTPQPRRSTQTHGRRPGQPRHARQHSR